MLHTLHLRSARAFIGVCLMFSGVTGAAGPLWRSHRVPLIGEICSQQQVAADYEPQLLLQRACLCLCCVALCLSVSLFVHVTLRVSVFCVLVCVCVDEYVSVSRLAVTGSV